MNEPDPRLQMAALPAGTDAIFSVSARAGNAAEVPVSITAERLPGTLPSVLNGRYRLEGLLGAGGMGMVYRARDLLQEQFGDPDPYAALKLLREDFADCPDGGALLYSEYALTCHLMHPNVVRVYSFEFDASCQQSFFSMALLRGRPLDRLLCEHPLGLDWQALRGMVLALLDALIHAHDRGVLHGDLKPGNVILCEDGARLFDFGLGQAMEGVLSGLPQLNRSRLNAWTPGYVAPELLDDAPLSPATDVFAIACLIYELACGKQPFGRLSAEQMRELSPGHRLERPTHLPGKLWPALRQALALDPAARRISADELRQALASSPTSFLQRWFCHRDGHYSDRERRRVQPQQ